MKTMEFSIYRNDIFRFYVLLGLIIFCFGFISCAGAPASSTTTSGSRKAPAEPPPPPPPKENKLGTVQIFYVDPVTTSLTAGEIQIINSPGDLLVGWEIASDATNSFKQLFDEYNVGILSDAISRFGVAERGSKFGINDARSFTFFGTVYSNCNWIIQTGGSPAPLEVGLDLGYLVKDRKTYFLVTQRDTAIEGDPAGRRTARITYCITMDQIRIMTSKLGIKLYEKPLLVFLGDGITSGMNAVTPEVSDPSSAYPAVLQDMLTINIMNGGVEWNTTADALERVEDILKYDPDVVVINIGLSDFVERIDPAVTNKNIQSIITVLKGGERKLFLTRFYDNFVLQDFMNDWGMSPKEQTDLINVYDGMFRNLSRTNNVDLITGIWDGLQHFDTISDDGFHPTKEGHKIMAGNFFNALKPYLSTNNYLKK